ncbi:Class III chitinase [Penicillium verhagenii]|uniref:Class III chitinase n=1 Tax=Penicillium verhagenii TaxID=1562060 RepID=UPI0025455DC8|nr:Class III chitinase [Penicillium verhagenii]KAJ5947567.1 Class III chitinase [Penicillium verhagenii]
MRQSQAFLPWSVLLASLGAVQARLDLSSGSNVVVYWGQNSLQGKGGEVQQSLEHYCENDDIDVIPIAFDMMVNGPGGAPEIDFSVTSQDCDVFPGTQLKNCPKIGQDIQTCQDKGKTILLSIGGATYSEGGFKSEADAKDGAKLIWETFGPEQADSKALRPFGKTSLDGFDFDFEASVQNMAPFANELRSLMDTDKSKQYFLTAAPQCPYPDAADKDILNGPVFIDAVWVQFYNNFCGVNNFDTNSANSKYNFEEWDNWAKTVSKNKNVKVMIGVPADTTAASTGYVPVDKVADVIEYTKKFESFGGVMMWDTSQAYANQGFIDGVRKALGGPNSGSSSSSTSASTTASAPTSTNSPNTSLSSNAPGSSSSSSSSSGSGSSSSGHEDPAPTPAPTTTTTKPADNPKPTETTTKAAPAPTTAKPADQPTATTKTEAAPKPTTTSKSEAVAPKPTTTTTKPAPAAQPTTTEAAPVPTKKPTTTEPAPAPKSTTTTRPSVIDDDDFSDPDLSPMDDSSDDDDIDNSPKSSAIKNGASKSSSSAIKDSATKDTTPKNELIGSDLFGLLKGLKQANGVVQGLTNGLTKGLTKNLRRAKRIGYN